MNFQSPVFVPGDHTGMTEEEEALLRECGAVEVVGRESAACGAVHCGGE